MKIERIPIHLKPETEKVLLRPFQPSEVQVKNIIDRILSLPEQDVLKESERVNNEFRERHRNIELKFAKRYEQISKYLDRNVKLSTQRKFLLGASLSMEYSIESAALFNPSIIWHPDQTGLRDGSKRFILSLRATGEGHISSIVFRTGILDSGNISMDDAGKYISSPESMVYPMIEKETFLNKMILSGIPSNIINKLASLSGDTFTIDKLEHKFRSDEVLTGEDKHWSEKILSIASSEYEIYFSGKEPLSERIIFPASSAESNGIEDARFVRFIDENGSVAFYGTYTAYNGVSIQPQLVETKDFINFRICKLYGPEIKNKGMAFFPRKVNGKYAMLSRQDAENNYIMFSDNIHFWKDKQLLTKPAYSWELVQSGNCGSPLETEKGWLVMTHGVGPVRKYSIGAMLLDLHDPTKVIGRLREPLISPDENEREGYVPNVVYSCGSIIHGKDLIIPYAMSDSLSSFAKTNLDDLLNKLTSGG